MSKKRLRKRSQGSSSREVSIRVSVIQVGDGRARRVLGLCSVVPKLPVGSREENLESRGRCFKEESPLTPGPGIPD